MLQQVATQKTNIASPSVAAEQERHDRKSQGNEFASIFKQQEHSNTEQNRQSYAEKAKLVDDKAEVKQGEKLDKPHAAEGDKVTAEGKDKVKAADDEELAAKNGGDSQAKTKSDEHHCEECQHKEKQAINDNNSSDAVPDKATTDNDDLLSLLQASQAADIKNNKVTGIDKNVELDPKAKQPVAEPVIEPDSTTVSTEKATEAITANIRAVESAVTAKEQAAVNSGNATPKAVVDTLAKGANVATHVDLTQKSVEPSADLQSKVAEISTELKLTPEQQKQLSALIDKLSQQQGTGEVEKLKKSDIKLLASLMGEKTSDAELSKLASQLGGDNGLAKLTNLSDDKADKVINQLASMLGVDKQPSSNKASFVDSLKAGLAEIKQQLQQGHEPGIDLKALVQQAMAKSSEGEVVVKPEQLAQSVQKMAQFLEAGLIKESTVAQTAAAASMTDRSLTVENQVRTDTVRQSTQQALQAQIDKPVNILKPEGHQQLANKVHMMVNQKNMVAEIRLDPPDLGSMSIKINMQGEQASVSFVVQSQQAQNVLEQSSPRLREMLAERGIELGQSSVQQDNPGNQAGKDKEQQLAGGKQSESEEPELDDNLHIHTRVVNGAVGGIDYFA